MDTTRSLTDSNPARQSTAEAMERMLQCANYGAQMLESFTLQQPTPSPEMPSPAMDKEPPPEEKVLPVVAPPGNGNAPATSSKPTLPTQPVSYHVPK